MMPTQMHHESLIIRRRQLELQIRQQKEQEQQSEDSHYTMRDRPRRQKELRLLEEGLDCYERMAERSSQIHSVGFDPDNLCLMKLLLERFREHFCSSTQEGLPPASELVADLKALAELGLEAVKKKAEHFAAAADKVSPPLPETFGAQGFEWLNRVLVAKFPDNPDGRQGGINYYVVEQVTAEEGRVQLYRTPKKLIVDLARAKAEGFPVQSRFSVPEAQRLDRNDPALFFCALLPPGIEHLLHKLAYMSCGYSNDQQHKHFSFGVTDTRSQRFVPRLACPGGVTAEALMLVRLALDALCEVFKADDLQVFDPATLITTHNGSSRDRQPLPVAAGL
ncbi:hypothetical protein OEZ86_006059 [Tetradesmus obliquus]|nr:hypothetical protein OEZ86_006059 [Tetradesmus obliquus]